MFQKLVETRIPRKPESIYLLTTYQNIDKSRITKTASSNICFEFLLERVSNKKQAFQYPKVILALSIANLDDSLRKQKKNKATLCSKIIKYYSLYKSHIAPRNSRCIYRRMTIFRMVTP